MTFTAFYKDIQLILYRIEISLQYFLILTWPHGKNKPSSKSCYLQHLQTEKGFPQKSDGLTSAEEYPEEYCSKSISSSLRGHARHALLHSGRIRAPGHGERRTHTSVISPPHRKQKLTNRTWSVIFLTADEKDELVPAAAVSWKHETPRLRSE